jgi:hypothetical protein
MNSTAVKISNDVLRDAKKHASVNMRSVPKQIEYWYNIGKLVEENPDLPFSFIKGVLEARKEMELGEVSVFEFRRA